MTNKDIDQIAEGIEEFIIAGDEALRPRQPTSSRCRWGSTVADSTIDMPPRISVDSKLLAGVAYHPESQTLEVEFSKSGAVYRYDGVDEAAFQALMHADSIGSHFLSKIKDSHGFTRVDV